MAGHMLGQRLLLFLLHHGLDIMANFDNRHDLTWKTLPPEKESEEEFHRKRGHSERKSVGEWPKAKE
jgi:hypothetical protein